MRKVKPAMKTEKVWTEILSRNTAAINCVISAGFVKGKNKPKVDDCYLRLEKDGVEPTVLLLSIPCYNRS
jgi:hypothetical protein